ncbi:MAG: iron-containing alcohol dehydrogenase [Chloroflexi bacterium]|nr:iron-containing alcohol dehydrogenase [Chloroflexota bacterium]
MNYKLFRNANNIVYGWGSLKHLKTLSTKKAVILTGKSAMQKLGFLGKAVAHLEKTGAKVEVIKGVKPEPPIEDVETYLAALNGFQPDLIVALGGGSVIDTAKALWAVYENPEFTVQEIFKAFVSRPLKLPNYAQKALLVAIPSTSGTGSETSAAAILIEAETKVKRVLLSSEVLPNIAIIDPEISAKMPPELTAHTGMDALTHAIESVVSPWSNHFSEPLALRSIQLVFHNLKAAYSEPNRDVRENMHYAATIAGMAINNSITGLAHGIDKIGIPFDIPHGLTIAILLPYSINFNASEAKTGYAKIARALDLQGASEEELTGAFLKSLLVLENDVGITKSFGELGINEQEYIDHIDQVSENALKAGPTIFSPRVPSAGELREIYVNAYHGKLELSNF